MFKKILITVIIVTTTLAQSFASGQQAHNDQLPTRARFHNPDKTPIREPLLSIDLALPYTLPRNVNDHILSFVLDSIRGPEAILKDISSLSLTCKGYSNWANEICFMISRSRFINGARELKIDLLELLGNERKAMFLDIREVRGITENTLIKAFSLCPNLISLNLEHTKELTDAGLVAIAKKCVNLSLLNISECRDITNAGLVAIIVGLPKLTSFQLKYCNKITNAGLIEIPEVHPNLRSLTLMGCSQIDDLGLGVIAERFPKLTSLDLMYCNRITNAGITAIAGKIPNLTSLSLWGCDQIDYHVLDVIAENFPQITYLNVWGWNQVTKFNGGGISNVDGKGVIKIAGTL